MRILHSTVLVVLSTLAIQVAQAQDLNATTEDGRRVVLSAGGTWKFDNRPNPKLSPALSASPYQPAVAKFSVNFDANAWTMQPKGAAAEHSKRVFVHKSLPLYAMVISDEMPTTTPALKQLLINNAVQAGAETTVLLDTTRTFSGHEVGAIRLAAAMRGVDFVFSTNYYADDDGNIQVVCYTGQPLFHKYAADCQKFIDGLVIN